MKKTNEGICSPDLKITNRSRLPPIEMLTNHQISPQFEIVEISNSNMNQGRSQQVSDQRNVEQTWSNQSSHSDDPYDPFKKHRIIHHPQDQEGETANLREVKNVFVRAKVRMLIEMYLEKISRNCLKRIHHVKRLPELESLHKKKVDEESKVYSSFAQAFASQKGVQLSELSYSLILFFDIISTMCLSMIATFEIFFREFKDTFSSSPAVMALKGIAILSIFLSLFERLFTIKFIYGQGKYLQTMKDITRDSLLNLGLYVDISIMVFVLISMVGSTTLSGHFQNAVLFLSIVKMYLLVRELPNFETAYIDTFHKQQYWNLFKVLIFDIFLAHLICNILLGMALVSPNNWIVAYNLTTEVWYVQYIWCYYWSITIMMTVGFGDYSPVNYIEAIIVAFIELFSCFILAMNISEVGNIIYKIRSMDQELRKKLSIFHRMKIDDQIDPALAKKVEMYLKETTRIRLMSEHQQRLGLLEEIPEILRKEYLAQANNRIFKKLPFFSNLQKDTLIQLVKKFESKVYYPGEMINLRRNFHQRKIESQAPWIIILKQGEVGFSYRRRTATNNGNILEILNIDCQYQSEAIQEVRPKEFKVQTTRLSNSQLLDISFISRIKSLSYDLIAQTYCFLYTMKKEDFLKVIREHELDFCYYFTLRHKHPLNENQYEFIKCPYCQRLYHSCFYCPRLQYMPVRGASVLRYLGQSHTKLVRHQYQRRKNEAFFMACPLKIEKDFVTGDLSTQKDNSPIRNLTRQFVKYSTNLGCMADYQQYLNLNHISMGQQSGNCNITKVQEILAKVVRHKMAKNLKGYKKQRLLQSHIESSFETFDDLDLLHDFVSYFQDQNPSHLIYFPLSSKIRSARKTAIFQ